MTDVVFETHATSEDNEAGIATGWLGGKLSPLGREQAAELGRRRRGDGIDLVVTSDLNRAVETAEIAFAGTGIPVRLDWRLRECDYGEWNGRPRELLDRERVRRVDEPWPGGESWRQAVARAVGLLDELARDHAGARVLLIGHIATRWALEHRVHGRHLEALAREEFAWQPGWDYRLLKYARPTVFYRGVALATKTLVERGYRLRVEGAEHVPAAGGFVAAANHTSNFDPWPLAIALWPRSVHFMAKQEAWKPPLKWVIAAAGSFPVRRGEGDVEALANAMRVCTEGRVMAMFPEGTRRRKGLRKRHAPRPHTGAARIALGAGVPLVPAALHGLDRLSRLARLEVRFGPPVELADLRGLPSHAAAVEATARLWAAIEELEG